MKKKLKKYSVGGFKPPKITQADINKVQQMEANTRLSKLTEDMSLASGILKGTNLATGAIADFVNNQNNTQFENEQYYKSLRNTGEDEFVQNDIPLYTKYGGGFPRDKALKILRDKKVNGKPLTDKQRKFFAVMAFKKAMEGIDLAEAPYDMYTIMEEGGKLSRAEMEKRLALEDKLRFERSLPENQGKRYNWYERNIKNPLEKMGVNTDAIEFGLEGASAAEGLISAAKLAKVGLKKLGKKSSEEIVRGHINWYDAPEFKAKYPNFKIDKYLADNSKFGRHTVEASEDMMPFDLKKLPSIRREDYRAAQRKIMDDKYNNPLDQKQEGGQFNDLDMLELMQEGGIPQRYKDKGFTKVGQKKQSSIEGKKWSVLAKKGDKYKIVHGGATGMSDYTKHKDPERRKRFWDRMGGKNSAKANDPFSPLYWHKRFGTWQEGGEILEVEGLPDEMAHQAWIEAEAGEVYQQPDGQILKIDEDGDRHEDGGELITNVERVLEDTSTTRRDKKSKALAITPDKMMAMFGMEVDKNLSHSEALEVVSQKIDKDTSKVKSKLNKVLKALDTMPNNKYAQNSLEFNTMELSKYPSKEEVFDMLFEHQESLKQERDMKQAKYGIRLPKAQDGLELLYRKAQAPGAKQADIMAFQKAFHSDSRTKSFAQNLIDNRKNITSYGKKMGYGKGNLKMNEDGLLGETTTSYFDYFKNNVAAPAPVAAPATQSTPVEAPVAPTVDPMAGIDYGLWTGGDEAPAAKTSTINNKEVDKDEEDDVSNPTQYSDFNEPLSWTDIASPAAAYLSADRMPARYNPAKFSKVTARMENVLPYLQQGQRDFNAITSMVDTSGSGQANLANVFAQKYAVDNQTRGAVTDRNLQRQSQADTYNAQVSDKQSVADQQARAVFEQQQLLGMEAQRKQKLQSLDEIMKRVNLNKKQNREGDLLMKLFPNFDSYGNYNQNRRNLGAAGKYSPVTGKETGTNAQMMEARMRQLGIVFPNMTQAERLRIAQEYGRNDRVDNRAAKGK